MYKCRLICYERLENTVIQTTYKYLKVSSPGLVEQYVASIAGSLVAALVLIIFSSEGRMKRGRSMCPFSILGSQLGSGIRQFCSQPIDRTSLHDLHYMIQLFELNRRLGIQSLAGLPCLQLKYESSTNIFISTNNEYGQKKQQSLLQSVMGTSSRWLGQRDVTYLSERKIPVLLLRSDIKPNQDNNSAQWLESE